MSKTREYININAVQKREHKRRLSVLCAKYDELHEWLFNTPSSHAEWQQKVQEYHAIGVKIEAMEQQ